MDKLMTIREFITAHSKGDWCNFEFYNYTCTSVDNFIEEYGKISEHILDDYVVTEFGCDYPTLSPGNTYYLTLMTFKEYELSQKELAPGHLTVGQEKILADYHRAVTDTFFLKDEPICDTGSWLTIVNYTTRLLDQLTEKDRGKIREIIRKYR